MLHILTPCCNRFFFWKLKYWEHFYFNNWYEDDDADDDDDDDIRYQLLTGYYIPNTILSVLHELSHLILITIHEVVTNSQMLNNLSKVTELRM